MAEVRCLQGGSFDGTNLKFSPSLKSRVRDSKVTPSVSISPSSESNCMIQDARFYDPLVSEVLPYLSWQDLRRLRDTSHYFRTVLKDPFLKRLRAESQLKLSQAFKMWEYPLQRPPSILSKLYVLMFMLQAERIIYPKENVTNLKAASIIEAIETKIGKNNYTFKADPEERGYAEIVEKRLPAIRNPNVNPANPEHALPLIKTKSELEEAYKNLQSFPDKKMAALARLAVFFHQYALNFE